VGLGVDEAARHVRTPSTSTSSPTSLQPVLCALQKGVAVERLRTVTLHAFTRAVLSTTGEDDEHEQALAAARALGGRTDALSTHVRRRLGGGEMRACMHIFATRDFPYPCLLSSYHSATQWGLAQVLKRRMLRLLKNERT
jgi:hypothetical protein